MRLNYAAIASEAKRRTKTLQKGDRSMDARKHHSAWRKDVPRILPALFAEVA